MTSGGVCSGLRLAGQASYQANWSQHPRAGDPPAGEHNLRVARVVSSGSPAQGLDLMVSPAGQGARSATALVAWASADRAISRKRLLILGEYGVTQWIVHRCLK